MKRPSKAHLATALAASTVAMTFTLAPSSNAATPFANGGFEADAVAGPFAAELTGSAIPSWTVAAGNVDQIGSLWDGAGDGQDQSIDLNGTAAGTICQSTSTVPGAPYRIDFSMSKNPGAVSATMDVLVDGTDVASEMFNLANSTGDMKWSARSAEFTAGPGESSEICFSSALPSTGAAGPALDEVSIVALNNAPTASIATPADGALYFQGQQVATDFACDDVDGNLDTRVDQDGRVSGSPLATGTPGAGSLEVTATDTFGATGQATADYTVAELYSACHAVGVLLPGTRISDANPGRTPCTTDKSTQVENDTIPLLIGSLTFEALAAVTQNTGTGMVGAATTAAKINLNLLGLQVKVENLVSAVQSEMGDGCSVVSSFGQSRAGRITILGQTYDIGTAPRTITLPLGLGAIYLNQQVQTATTITQRAVFVDLPGTFLDIAVGQAATGVSCDGPVTVASVVKENAKPSKAEVEDLRNRLERVESQA